MLIFQSHLYRKKQLFWFSLFCYHTNLSSNFWNIYNSGFYLIKFLHLGFAFPFIHKLLMLFNLTNLKLLIGTTVVTFAIYAVFYTLVYRITSNSYYSIVAGAKEDAA